MDTVVCVQLLALVTLANGAPVLGKRLLGKCLACPVDGGLVLPDGAPLLGPAKTVRGIVLAIIAGTAGAPLLGMSWRIGLIIGVTAMVGDMLSSFVKRRLGMEASSRATGLDQIPESLLPLLAIRDFLHLGLAEITAVTIAFLIGEIVLSRLLYQLRLRDRPY